MNTKWLESFLAVARCGSVTAAAREQFISPQALLQQINLLEDAVGTRLFSRSRGGMSLTLAGREFASGARDILSRLDMTLNRCLLVSRAEEVIRIPMMSSLILPKFMETVCAEYRHSPDSRFRTEFVSDENMGGWMDGLCSLRYDIIEHYCLDGTCPKGIHFELLNSIRSWCILPDYHPLSDRESITPEDLDGCLVLAPEENIQLMRYFQLYCDARGLKIERLDIPNDRYRIIDGLSRGGVYIADEDISRIFAGFVSVPLDFDMHVRHGLACREDMAEAYAPFFNIAHEVFQRKRE